MISLVGRIGCRFGWWLSSNCGPDLMVSFGLSFSNQLCIVYVVGMRFIQGIHPMGFVWNFDGRLLFDSPGKDAILIVVVWVVWN